MVVVMPAEKPVVRKKVYTITFHVLQLFLYHLGIIPTVKTFQGRVWLLIQIRTFIRIFGVVDPALGTPYIRIFDERTILFTLETGQKTSRAFLPVPASQE